MAVISNTFSIDFIARKVKNDPLLVCIYARITTWNIASGIGGRDLTLEGRLFQGSKSL